MCGISASFSSDQFRELVSLNQVRGEFSFSYTKIFKLDTSPDDPYIDFEWKKGFGKFPLDLISDDKSKKKIVFHIGHCQAPTGGLVQDPNRIHPAEHDGMLLYHNGIIKDDCVKTLQEKTGNSSTWDTGLFVKYLNGHLDSTKTFEQNLGDRLSGIDGSFACILYHKRRVFVFRSRAIAMFVNGISGSFSSAYFAGSELLRADTIFEVNLASKQYRAVGQFTSKSSPYFIREHLPKKESNKETS